MRTLRTSASYCPDCERLVAATYTTLIVDHEMFWTQVAIAALCLQLMRYSSNDRYTLTERMEDTWSF